MQTLFLHGLESSSNGTKGRFLKGLLPDIIAPDFEGSLENRMQQLESLCSDRDDLILIGSSFGGLMATCFTIKYPEKVNKLVLFAPALNFPEFNLPLSPLTTPAELFIGDKDKVTPPQIVIPLALKTFTSLVIHEVQDDHLLHQIYQTLDWQQLTSTTLD